MKSELKIPHSILTDARSVLGLASHAKALKDRLDKFKEKFLAKKRKYLTPSEEEELRQIIVSYWQIRSALFDITLPMKVSLSRWFFKKDQKYLMFIIGYASAIVLVDFARFLNKNFDNIRPIRKKIDEPDKQFNIPAGIYDTIQESLINPVHLWQINKANRFYKKHKSKLEMLASSHPDLSKILSLIKRFQSSIDIKERQYIKITFSIRLRQIGHFFTKSALQQAIYAVQEEVSKTAGHIKTRVHTPHLPREIQKQLKAILRPGDILITRKDFQLTNYFLPGYWPHAALYMGRTAMLKKMKISSHKNVKAQWKTLKKVSDEASGLVLESLKDGVHVRPLTTPFTCDAITIIRPKTTPEHIEKSIKRGLLHEGKPYDFDFDFTQSQRLVCTAVVYRSYEGMGNIGFELTKRAGRLTLSAEDLLNMAIRRDFFEPVAVYCPYKRKELVFSSDVDEILKATIGKKV